MYTVNVQNIQKKARSTSLDKSNSDPENLNMMHTRVGAIKSGNISNFGQETVGIQGSGRPVLRVRLQDPMQSPGSSRLLNWKDMVMMSRDITGP